MQFKILAASPEDICHADAGTDAGTDTGAFSPAGNGSNSGSGQPRGNYLSKILSFGAFTLQPAFRVDIRILFRIDTNQRRQNR